MRRPITVLASLLALLTLPAAASAAQPAPTGASVSGGDRYLDVSWAAQSGCSSYQVAWRTTASPTGSVTKYVRVTPAVPDSAALSYRITGVANRVQYFVGLQCASPASAWTADGSLTGIPMTDADAKLYPRGVRTLARDRAIEVRWPANTSACQSYHVAWRTTADPSGSRTSYSPAFRTVTDDVVAYRITGLSNNQRYFVGVQCASPSGPWTVDGTVSAVPTADCKLAAPTAVRMINRGGTFLTIAWDPNCAADAYNVWMSPPGKYTIVRGANQLAVTGLRSETEYTFDVQSRKGDLASPWAGRFVLDTEMAHGAGW